MRSLLRRRCEQLRSTGEQASAIIEFVFVAVLVLVPLIYLIVAVAVVQRSRLATTNAARDVGRAIATSATAPSLAPASVFAICVVRHQPLPAIPTLLSGRGVTVIGRYLVHIDDFRVIAR